MKKTGFTQVELLAVGICVLLLGTLMLPMLGAAQEDAALVACTAQLKKIAQAQQQYLKDNKGFFIPYHGITPTKTLPSVAPCTGKAINWKREKGKMLQAEQLTQQNSVFVPLIMRYMGGDFTPTYCPGDYRMSLSPTLYAAQSSYAYHTTLGKGYTRKFPGFDTPNIENLGEPAEVVLFAESSAGRGTVAAVPEGKGWMYFRDTTQKDIAHKPHGDRYNFAFVDGHVSSFSFQEVISMAFDEGL